jgi:Tol biopolymer transport system component
VVRAFIPAPENSTFVSLGLGPGGAGPVVISPDGTQLAFVAKANGGTERLHVRAVDSLIARPLVNTEGARYPFWSDDSKSIAFFAGGKLKKIDASGGPPVALCNAASGRGGTWNRDGVILFTPESEGPIHRVTSEEGASTPLTVMKDTEETHRWPFFLPDGQHFLYFIRTKGGASFSDKNNVWLGSLDGSVNHTLIQVSSNPVYASGHVLFIRDATLMRQAFDADRLELTGGAFPIAEQVLFDGGYTQGVFSASQNGVLVFQSGSSTAGSQLVWLDREGKELGLVGEPALYDTLRLSPDGKLAAVGIIDGAQGQRSTWMLDIARGVRTRFTSKSAWDMNAVWSPDGSRIVFASDRSGRYNIYQQSIGGVGEEELFLPLEFSGVPWDWSLDGRWILLTPTSPQQIKGDLWAVETSGDLKPVPILQTPFDEAQAGFSPDGRWVVFVSDESGQREVNVLPFPGPGRKWQISTAGGFSPGWRRDGKEIFYLSLDLKLMSVEVIARESSFEQGSPKTLFQFAPPGTGVPSIDVTADGQKFLVRKALETKSEPQLTLVVNWDAGLKKP